MVEQMQLNSTEFQFDADDCTEKERLAHLIWRGELLTAPESNSLRSGNSDLVMLLLLLTKNTYNEVSDRIERKDALWQEAMLSNLTRIKSQKMHTLLTVRVSIEALRVQLDRNFWQLLHLLGPGIFTAHRWADEFVSFCFKHRPGPKYEVLPGVGCVMFDNYTRKVNYSSVHTTDSWGFRLDMTNSCGMAIPRHLAPANFDATAICALLACHSLPCFCAEGLCCHLLRESSLRDAEVN